MKMLTASAFVQLTFGLKKYRLNWFKYINIVHKPYHYKNSELLFHGDTNPITKQINMVWPVVLKGFEIHNDALNLSIHELSHGLVIENSKASFFTPYFSYRKWRKWKVLASNEIQDLKAGRNSFFRAYGSKSLMEFFAVSTEAFFEQPRAFGNNYPKLYKAHCRLLNQDPRYSTAPKLKYKVI